ncbi:MAG: GNAT family N-acetyltransferase [Proteobacteria bacterium]|nr:GNAT family N-acetyltransferase [Pseudomonadota bacterium]
MDQSFKIETKRTLLRSYQSNDLNDHVTILNNWEVTKWLSNAIPFPYSRTDGELFINDEVANFILGNRVTFLIIEKTTNCHMGGIRLFSLQNEDCEIGYWLGPDYWNKGYASEILDEIINWAFNHASINQLFALTTEKNIPSQNLLKKMGFFYRGAPPKQHTRCGQTEGCSAYFVLEKQSWLSSIQKLENVHG